MSSYYLSILSGILLAVSEILPQISQVKGNSISEVLLNAFGKLDVQRQDKLDLILAKVEELTCLLKTGFTGTAGAGASTEENKVKTE